MRADLTLPGGATARIGCSMFSSSVLRMQAVVEGELGSLRVWNPFAPQFGHRITVRTRADGRTVRRVEHVTREPTYDFQLRAFAAAVSAAADPGTDPGAAAIPTGPDDAVANMAVIDDVYRAAGLEPRRPTA